jgi:hypothetical protein
MKNIQPSILLLFLIVVLSNQQCQSQKASSQKSILDVFEQWKSEQYTKRTHVELKDCTIDAVINGGENHPGIGIPNEFQVSYAYINDDDQLDALVLFSPRQCDGGNASMNAQTRVLILSQGQSYTIDDTFIDQAERKHIESMRTWGFFWIERAIDGHFYGTYSAYKDEDPRCCPSIERKFRLSYATGELYFFEN